MAVVKTPAAAPKWLTVVAADENPGLWEEVETHRLFDGVWPEYNLHGTYTGQYFSVLFPRFAHVQALLLDARSDEVIARVRCIPFRWDGSLDDLPRGIDAVGLRAIGEHQPPTALSALAAEVRRDYQGAGLSDLLVDTMALLARSCALTTLVAPVRPSHKDRYPLIPIDRYVTWRREDGQAFDPWIRVHLRKGGRILRCEPQSLEVAAPVTAWQRWIKMPFPDDGQFVFPGGLALLTVAQGIGTYFEPNVWIVHDVRVP